MATITLTGNTLCGSLGIGSFTNIGTALSKTKQSTNNLISELNSLKNKIDVACIAASVDASKQQISNTKNREETKKSSLSLAYDRLDKLISNVGIVDNKVAAKVEQLKNDFYSKYSYLKPEREKSIWERITDGAKNLWDGICDWGNALVDFVGDVVEWIAEHWKELLIGLAFIVVGAIITCLTGGATLGIFIAALAKGIVTAVIAGFAAGVLNSGITYGMARLSGMPHNESLSIAKSAFGDGFATGFMMGGIGFAGGAFGSAMGTTYKTFRAIQYTAKISGTISISMMGFDLVSQISGLVNPDSKLYSLNQFLHKNKYYNYFQMGITGLAVFSGAAYSKAEITDGSHMYKNSKGDMVPRSHVKYSSGEDGTCYHYVTGRKGENGTGLIKKGYAERLDLKASGRKRYTNDRNTPGKIKGYDDSGHIFGDRFNGSRKLDNLTSQAHDVNQRRSGHYTYKSMEDKWAKTLNEGGEVTNVKVKINYRLGSSRPSSYRVNFSMNGERFSNIFKNVNN